MGLILYFAVTLSFVIIPAYMQIIDKFNNETSDLDVYQNTKVLSRTKRFIIFPEGSSLQLVFCNTFPAITSIGDIFLWGYTGALAYELPQDPYSPFDHHADPLHRRMDKKEIYYTDENGRIIHKQPYKKKFIVNPAFAKRSVDGRSTETDQLKKGREFKIDRKQMHASANREFLKSEHMEKRSVGFHRSSRTELYSKIETMLQGLGNNGKHCMLKTLCFVGQSQDHPQGDFLQEILRVVFTLPKGHDDDDLYKDYDTAHWATHSCDSLYPECDDSLPTTVSPTLSY